MTVLAIDAIYRIAQNVHDEYFLANQTNAIAISRYNSFADEYRTQYSNSGGNISVRVDTNGLSSHARILLIRDIVWKIVFGRRTTTVHYKTGEVENMCVYKPDENSKFQPGNFENKSIGSFFMELWKS